MPTLCEPDIVICKIPRRMRSAWLFLYIGQPFASRTSKLIPEQVAQRGIRKEESSHGKELEEGQETRKDPAPEEEVVEDLERATGMAKRLKKAKKLTPTKPLRK